MNVPKRWQKRDLLLLLLSLSSFSESVLLRYGGFVSIDLGYCVMELTLLLRLS